jgi:hypothetical protein
MHRSIRSSSSPSVVTHHRRRHLCDQEEVVFLQQCLLSRRRNVLRGMGSIEKKRTTRGVNGRRHFKKLDLFFRVCFTKSSSLTTPHGAVSLGFAWRRRPLHIPSLVLATQWRALPIGVWVRESWAGPTKNPARAHRRIVVASSRASLPSPCSHVCTKSFLLCSCLLACLVGGWDRAAKQCIHPSSVLTHHCLPHIHDCQSTQQALSGPIICARA